MKILIVDDSTINNILLQNILEESGFDVLTALNGYDALDIIKREDVSVVLLDIMMPGFSGFDFLKHLNVMNKKIPVIAISANSDSDFKNRSLEMGATYFLTKPIQFKILLKKIKEIMALA